jgi:putative oxidoreductase
MDVGLLLLHGFAGAALVAHGLQKLVVFRIGATAAYLESVGFRAPRSMAFAVIGAELTGGVVVALGLLMPLGAVLIASTMLIAARTDHRGKGWFITSSGAEFVATNAVIALVLAATGGGRYSLDRALGLHDAGAMWIAGVAVAALLAGGVVLSGLFQRSGLPEVVKT